MDSLTVTYLARELAARWQGRRVRASVLDRARRTVTIAVDGSRPVCFDLSARDVRVVECLDAPAEGAVAGWTVVGVSARPDDRRLVVHLEKAGKFRGSSARAAVLELSVMPAARGAVLSDDRGHRLGMVGAKMPPMSEPRPVLTSEQVREAVLAHTPAALYEGRWMSPLLARWLVHLEADRAAEAYAALCTLPDARPAWCGGRLVPFPWCDDARPAPSLIAGASPDQDAPPDRAPTRRARSAARMREELARAAAAPALRRVADALLAMGDAPAPAEVQLAGGARQTVPIRAAGESAVDVAERLYREVRSMERALRSLPARIAEFERDVSPTEDATPDAGGSRRRTPARRAAEPRVALPYKSYRSSGGLDIWVGRGAASNDALTFRHSSPNDVWLHARDAAGAHVVLRWPHEASPPARDLEEAATLAAWHSKIRSSTLAPVDWTRRKYVRKVRGGAPGLVAVQRARTIFVRPRAEVERALRTE